MAVGPKGRQASAASSAFYTVGSLQFFRKGISPNDIKIWRCKKIYAKDIPFFQKGVFPERYWDMGNGDAEDLCQRHGYMPYYRFQFNLDQLY